MMRFGQERPAPANQPFSDLCGRPKWQSVVHARRGRRRLKGHASDSGAPRAV